MIRAQLLSPGRNASWRPWALMVLLAHAGLLLGWLAAGPGQGLKPLALRVLGEMALSPPPPKASGSGSAPKAGPSDPKFQASPAPVAWRMSFEAAASPSPASSLKPEAPPVPTTEPKRQAVEPAPRRRDAVAPGPSPVREALVSTQARLDGIPARATLSAAPAANLADPPESPPVAIVSPTPGTSTSAATDAPGGHKAPVEWPVSTRLSFDLTGQFRGELSGSAEANWVQVDGRYTMDLDIIVGSSFAPLMRRQLRSSGRITPQGLSPERYEQSTRMAFQGEHRVSLRFEAGWLTLAHGPVLPAWPGVQDTASQFVQLTHLLRTGGLASVPGTRLDLPLALPYVQRLWPYEVVGEELLSTRLGELRTLHLRPVPGTPVGGDLAAEIWFAPELQYLPVRFRISQNDEQYIELMLKRAPELTAP